MKTWIRRTLIGVVGATALFGGLAAWAHHRHGGCWHGDAAACRERLVEHASRRLDLDTAQKARLDALLGVLQTQRRSLLGDAADPRAEVLALLAAPSFDRARAAALAQSRLQALQLGAPSLVDAFGDFYDGLRPEQQARLREAIERTRRHRR